MKPETFSCSNDPYFIKPFAFLGHLEIQFPGAEEKSRHIVGYNLTEQEGRVSSAIQHFDPETSVCTTRKGRKYRLVKDYHCDPNNDAMYVWDFWQRLNKIVEPPVDVTGEYHK